jgi:hypothetical protein
MKKLLTFITIIFFFVSSIGSAHAQKITPGSTCKVHNQKVTNQNKVYTCIKSGKKLVWNKGVVTIKTRSLASSNTNTNAHPNPND